MSCPCSQVQSLPFVRPFVPSQNIIVQRFLRTCSEQNHVEPATHHDRPGLAAPRALLMPPLLDMSPMKSAALQTSLQSTPVETPLLWQVPQACIMQTYRHPPISCLTCHRRTYLPFPIIQRAVHSSPGFGLQNGDELIRLWGSRRHGCTWKNTASFLASHQLCCHASASAAPKLIWTIGGLVLAYDRLKGRLRTPSLMHLLSLRCSHAGLMKPFSCPGNCADPATNVHPCRCGEGHGECEDPAILCINAGLM